MAKRTPKKATASTDLSAAKIAKDMQRFQKRRERALQKIDELVRQIDDIDAEINSYLKDVPVLL